MTLELQLERRWFYPELPGLEGATVGELRIAGVLECYTLEDLDRLEAHADDPRFKVAGRTAIPAGRYRVDMKTVSPRFGVIMPRLVGVPGYAGVLIHTGNEPKHTLGCILVGRQRAERKIHSSSVAYDALFAKLLAADKAGEEIWLTITRAPEAERAIS